MRLIIALCLLTSIMVSCTDQISNNLPTSERLISYSIGEIHNKAMNHGASLYRANPGFTDRDAAESAINAELNNFVLSHFGTFGGNRRNYLELSSQTSGVLQGMPSGWKAHISQELDQLEAAGAISVAERNLFADLENHLNSPAPNYRKELLVESVVIDFEGLPAVDQTQTGTALLSISEHSTDWWIDEIDGETVDAGERILADIAGAIHGAMVALGVDLLDGDGVINWGGVLDGAISGAINASFGIIVGWITTL